MLLSYIYIKYHEVTFLTFLLRNFGAPLSFASSTSAAFDDHVFVVLEDDLGGKSTFSKSYGLKKLCRFITE